MAPASDVVRRSLGAPSPGRDIMSSSSVVIIDTCRVATLIGPQTLSAECVWTTTVTGNDRAPGRHVAWLLFCDKDMKENSACLHAHVYTHAHRHARVQLNHRSVIVYSSVNST